MDAVMDLSGFGGTPTGNRIQPYEPMTLDYPDRAIPFKTECPACGEKVDGSINFARCKGPEGFGMVQFTHQGCDKSPGVKWNLTYAEIVGPPRASLR